MTNSYPKRSFTPKRPKRAFNLSRILAQANEKTQDNFVTWSLAASVFLLVVAIVVLTLSRLISIEALANLSFSDGLVISYLCAVLLAPFTAGIYQMGIRCAQNQSIVTLDIVGCLPSILGLALVQLIVIWLVSIGLLLLVLPGLYLLIATAFAVPLVAERNCGIFASILLSITTVNRYLGQFFLLFMMFFALSMLAFATFGIVLLWVVPFYYCVLGLIYVELFGYGEGVSTSEPMSRL